MLPCDQYHSMVLKQPLLVLLIHLVLDARNHSLFLSKCLNNIHSIPCTKIKNISIELVWFFLMETELISIFLFFSNWVYTGFPIERQMAWLWFISLVVIIGDGVVVGWSVCIESSVDGIMVGFVWCAFVVLSAPNLSIKSSMLCTSIGWPSFVFWWRLLSTSIGWSVFGFWWRSTHL